MLQYLLIIISTPHVFNLTMWGYSLFWYLHVRFPGNFMFARVFWKWFHWNIPTLAVECHHCAIFGVTFAPVWIIRHIIVTRVTALDPVVLFGSRKIKKCLLRDWMKINLVPPHGIFSRTKCDQRSRYIFPRGSSVLV